MYGKRRSIAEPSPPAGIHCTSHSTSTAFPNTTRQYNARCHSIHRLAIPVPYPVLRGECDTPSLENVAATAESRYPLASRLMRLLATQCDVVKPAVEDGVAWYVHAHSPKNTYSPSVSFKNQRLQFPAHRLFRGLDASPRFRTSTQPPPPGADEACWSTHPRHCSSAKSYC